MEQTIDELVGSYRASSDDSGQPQQSFNWVVQGHDYPSPSSPMESIINPIVDTVRNAAAKQDEQARVVAAHSGSIEFIKLKLMDIEEQLAVGQQNNERSGSEEATVKVLKASMKLLQEQIADLKKQVKNMKKEPGEIIEAMELDRSEVKGASAPADMKKGVQIDISKAPTGPAASRRLASPGKGKENSLVLYQPDAEIDISKHAGSGDVLTNDQTTKQIDNAVIRKLDNLTRRIGALEESVVHEINEQRYVQVRNRSYLTANAESAKTQITEIWKVLMQMEGRDIGEPRKTAHQRHAKCLGNDNSVIYWRDKLVNASQITALEGKMTTHKELSQAINTMDKYAQGHDASANQFPRTRHTPPKYGLAFLKRCATWWKDCYQDARIFQMKVLRPSSISQRSLSLVDARQARPTSPFEDSNRAKRRRDSAASVKPDHYAPKSFLATRPQSSYWRPEDEDSRYRSLMEEPYGYDTSRHPGATGGISSNARRYYMNIFEPREARMGSENYPLQSRGLRERSRSPDRHHKLPLTLLQRRRDHEHGRLEPYSDDRARYERDSLF